MTFKKIFIALFFLIITLPFLDYFIPILPQNTNSENTSELKPPKLKSYHIKSLAKFSIDVFKYYNHIDRGFNGRSFLIQKFITLKINLLNSCKPIPQVIMGKDHWIFLSKNKYTNVTMDYLNAQPFNDAELETIKQNLKENYTYMKQRNIAYYAAVVPNSQTIYPEYFPSFLVKNEKYSRFQQINNYLSKTDSSLHIIDLSETLRKYKGDTLLYYRTDTHWNSYGAYLGYCELIKNFQREFPDITMIKRSDLKINLETCPGGDNARMLDKAAEYKDLKAEITIDGADETIMQIDSSYTSKSLPLYYFRIKNNNKKLKILFFRDSCTGYLTDYVSQSFGESVFFWETVPYKKIIEREKPDIVLQIVVERDIARTFLQHIMDDKNEN
jgi:alginate O-acetyltransferase complex protein AlgJ